MAHNGSRILSTAAALLLALAAAAALAQPFPGKPVTLITPFTPGSGSDATARAVSPTLGEVLGAQVVVQNAPGAGGSIGARMGARARPDGYTLLLASISFSVIPSLMKLDYDPVKDFEAVTMLGLQPFVLAVPASLPAASLRELIELARAQPGKLNYASAGAGSIGHLQWELLKMDRNVELVHIPYKGTPEALVGILAGEVHMSLISLPTALPHVKAGKVKALGVTGDRRSPDLPDAPTIAEAGFPNLNDSVWYAILAPAGTPREIVLQLNAAFVKTLASPEAVKRLAAVGTEAKSSTPEEAAAYVREQVAKWAKVVAAAGIRVDAK